jgi:hypothetical protein
VSTPASTPPQQQRSIQYVAEYNFRFSFGSSFELDFMEKWQVTIPKVEILQDKEGKYVVHIKY